MDEIWIDCVSIRDAKVSSWGRVLLPPTTALMPNGKPRSYVTKPIIGCVRRATKKASHVYRGFQYRGRNYKVHRLICEAFHGVAPFANAVVIHIDEDALNNRSENLRWGTQKENLNMPKIKAYHRSRVGDHHPKQVGLRNGAVALSQDNTKA